MERSDDPNFALGWFRISAFPKFATTYEELVEWIDQAAPEMLETYRQRFRDLLNSIASERSTFVHRRRYARPGKALQIQPHQENLASLLAEWVEEDAADVYVPEASVAIVGHDDFGCNCYYDLSTSAAEDWIRGKVAAAGLFCVQHPIEPGSAI